MKDKRILRCNLVHYTLQEYLQAHHQDLFPEQELKMARLCLTYLSLEQIAIRCAEPEIRRHFHDKYFGHGDRATVREQLKSFGFLQYAASNWAQHVRPVQSEIMAQLLTFYTDGAKVSASVRIWESYRKRESLFLWSKDGLCSPIDVAAFWRLNQVLDALLDSQGIRKDMALFFAVKGRNNDGIKALLDNEAEIDVRDDNGKTPLHHAVLIGLPDTVSFLLDQGSDVNAQDRDGWTPLCLAAGTLPRLSWTHSWGILELLLRYNPEVKITTRAGSTVLHVCALMRNHYIPTIIDTLLKHGVSIDAQDIEGQTALHVAAEQHHTVFVISLAKHQPRLDVKEIMGRTPLHLAVKSRSYMSVNILGQPNVMNMQDVNGRTPLHYAYFAASQDSAVLGDVDDASEPNASKKIVRKLSEGCASDEVPDLKGRVPSDYKSWRKDSDWFDTWEDSSLIPQVLKSWPGPWPGLPSRTGMGVPREPFFTWEIKFDGAKISDHRNSNTSGFSRVMEN